MNQRLFTKSSQLNSENSQIKSAKKRKRVNKTIKETKNINAATTLTQNKNVSNSEYNDSSLHNNNKQTKVSQIKNILIKGLILIVFILIIFKLSSFFLKSQRYLDQLEVKAQVTVPVVLDIAEISFVTKSEGEDLPTLIQTEDQKMSLIQNYLQSVGIKEEDIYINRSFFSVSPSSGIFEFSTINSLQTFYRVVLRNLENNGLNNSLVTEIQKNLYEIGINRIDLVEFRSEKIDQICQDMLFRANQQAENRAIDMVQKLGKTTIVEKKFETVIDCEAENYSYFGTNNSNRNKIQNFNDLITNFPGQKQELKTVVKLSIRYY